MDLVKLSEIVMSYLKAKGKKVSQVDCVPFSNSDGCQVRVDGKFFFDVTGMDLLTCVGNEALIDLLDARISAAEIRMAEEQAIKCGALPPHSGPGPCDRPKNHQSAHQGPDSSGPPGMNRFEWHGEPRMPTCGHIRPGYKSNDGLLALCCLPSAHSGMHSDHGKDGAGFVWEDNGHWKWESVPVFVPLSKRLSAEAPRAQAPAKDEPEILLYADSMLAPTKCRFNGVLRSFDDPPRTKGEAERAMDSMIPLPSGTGSARIPPLKPFEWKQVACPVVITGLDGPPGPKRKAPLKGKVCDCGAEKCRTTHAAWCSTNGH